jgi:chromosome segregation ATPase
VKEDIGTVEARQKEAEAALSRLAKGLADTTSKEEFYDFIRELNDELRKLEKNIATQGSLERHKAALNTQLRELSEEIKARKEMNRQLKKLPEMDQRTQELKKRLNKLDSMDKKLDALEKNYLNWKAFISKLETINKDDRDSEISKLRQEFQKKLNAGSAELSALEEKAMKKEDLKQTQKELMQAVLQQAKLIKTQESRISRLEKSLGKSAPRQKQPKKLGSSISSLLKEKSYIFPLIVLVLLAALLTIGIVFYKDDIFSGEAFLGPKDIECQQEYECTLISNTTVLSNCIYDEVLEGCHCEAKLINLTQC